MNRTERRVLASARQSRRRAAARAGQLPTCPKCRSTNVVKLPTSVPLPRHPAPGFYDRELEGCRRCKAIWEAVPRELIWDPPDPLCSFSEPCGNCAFRPGSPEQQDREGWREMIADLQAGVGFYCHKGVPIDPDSPHGFRYPTRDDGTPDRGRMRLCRGYLNMIGSLWAKAGVTP